MKKEVLTYWEETFGKMVKTKQWADVLEKQAWVDLFLTGDKLQKFLADELTMYQNLAKELGLVQ
jgi:tripartite-type tricarboxylate transporter receptor subunit TctC